MRAGAADHRQEVPAIQPIRAGPVTNTGHY